MHTYTYTALLASNSVKTADVTFDVTRRFSQIYTPLFTTLSTVKTCQNLQMVIGGIWLLVMMKFLTANEVCEWLRLSRKGLWDLERSGELIPDRIGRRLRYREHEIMNYLDKSREKNTLVRNASNSSLSADWKALAQKTLIDPKSHTYIYAQSESLSVEEIDRAFQEQNQQGSIGSAL